LAGAPNNSKYYSSIGYCFSLQGKLDKALINYLKSYELDPNSYVGLWGICNIYLGLNKWIEAEKYTNILINRHPENNLGYREKSRILLSGYGQINKAREILNEGWELVDGENSLIYWLWNVEIYARDYEAALEIIDRNRGSNFYPWIKANTFRLMDRSAEVEAIYDSLRIVFEHRKEIGPDIADYHRSLGWIYAQLGRKKEAIDECTKAEELSPGSKQTARRLTDIHIITGDHDKALEKLKELVDVPGSGIRLWDLKLDPFYDPLRNDPRFIELIK